MCTTRGPCSHGPTLLRAHSICGRRGQPDSYPWTRPLVPLPAMSKGSVCVSQPNLHPLGLSNALLDCLRSPPGSYNHSRRWHSSTNKTTCPTGLPISFRGQRSPWPINPDARRNPCRLPTWGMPFLPLQATWLSLISPFLKGNSLEVGISH